jgi:hypothetical protein
MSTASSLTVRFASSSSRISSPVDVPSSGVKPSAVYGFVTSRTTLPDTSPSCVATGWATIHGAVNTITSASRATSSYEPPPAAPVRSAACFPRSVSREPIQTSCFEESA